MFEMLYVALITVCLAGRCEEFAIDGGLTFDDCIALVLQIGDTTPNYIVPMTTCKAESEGIKV